MRAQLHYFHRQRVDRLAVLPMHDYVLSPNQQRHDGGKTNIPRKAREFSPFRHIASGEVFGARARARIIARDASDYSLKRRVLFARVRN